MTGQLDIDGRVQPVTWDGEPVYSPETVAEGLFDGGTFEQMKGQLPIEAMVIAGDDGREHCLACGAPDSGCEHCQECGELWS